MKEKKKRYSRNLKLEIVRLSFEKCNLEELAAQFHITTASLLHWRKNYIINGEENFSLSGKTTLTIREKKIYDLEIKIRKADIEFKIIKGSAKFRHKGLQSLYGYISENEQKYSSYLMCATLGISLDSYKKWKSNVISERKKERIKLKEKITAIFTASKKRYGSMRIAVELQKSGYAVSADKVLNCMRELNLYAEKKEGPKKTPV